MATVVKELVEYTGLTDIPPVLTSLSCFKQFNLQNIYKLPDAKPGARKILRVISDTSVTDKRIRSTLCAVSEEGFALTGRKLFIEGRLLQKIEYCSDTSVQAKYISQFSMPFITSIVLPKEITSSASMLISEYILNVTTELIDERNILSSTVLLFSADC